MWINVAYSALAVVAVLVAAGAIWVVAQAAGAAQALSAMSELRTRITELETAFGGFAEQFELSYIRSAAKIGKLRRQLAKERGEDEDSDEEAERVPVERSESTSVPAFRSGADVLRFAKDQKLVS